MAGNTTDFVGRGLGIDNSSSLIALKDDYFVFNLSRLTLDFDLGYEFVADPPIIADIGFVNLTLVNFTVLFDMSTDYKDDSMIFNISNVNADLEKFGFFIDGLNDFIYTTNGLIGRVLGLIAGKAKWILENEIERLIPLINNILALIPNVIPIEGTALELDIGFA